MKKFVLLSAVFVALAWFAAGCGNGQSAVPTSTYLFDAEHFDLAAVVALIRDGHVANAADLERRINDPAAGINNVDLDRDGQVDFVRVVETQNGGLRRYEFMGHPSGNPNDISAITLVASAQFALENGAYVLNAGYPHYAYGYDAHYFHHTLHNVAFLTWAYGYHPVYVMPYSSFGYHPYRVYAPSVLVSTRRTYQAQYRISPVAAVARPANSSFLRPNSYQVPSSLRSRMVSAPADSRLASRSGMVTPFSRASTNVNARRATGFGASSPSTASSGSWGRSTSTASSPTRSSTSSFGRSSSGSSFGRSSGSSGFGRSSSFGRSSFGSRR